LQFFGTVHLHGGETTGHGILGRRCSIGRAVAAAPAGLPDVPTLSDLEMRSNETEVLGYYIHSPPLAEFQGLIESICTHGTGDLGGTKAKDAVVIGGLVSALKLSNTKQARPGSTHTRYGMFDLEDMDGIVRSICWPICGRSGSIWRWYSTNIPGPRAWSRSRI
jgi:DNA polymerase III alpha subunit